MKELGGEAQAGGNLNEVVTIDRQRLEGEEGLVMWMSVERHSRQKGWPVQTPSGGLGQCRVRKSWKDTWAEQRR